MTTDQDLYAVATRFIDAFSAADFDGMRAALAPGLVASVTNADGTADRVVGRDAYLARIEAMNLPAVRFSVAPTQPPVRVGESRVLLMVEVRAERDDRSLHNFAAHLLRIADGQITEWLMVDAKPAESDAFWG